MIEWISNWAGGIIVAVVIGTIIEMILPEGNSKKYIKMVIGVYILFTIVSPVITKFTGNSMQVSDVLDIDQYIEEAKNSVEVHNTLVENNEQNIREMYISGIEDDMKAKLKAKGYLVKNIELGISNDDTYTINTIRLEIEKVKDEEVNNEIDDDNSKDNKNIEKVEKIEKVNIDSDNSLNNTESTNEEKDTNQTDLSNKEVTDIKEYLSSVYEVNEDNIAIN